MLELMIIAIEHRFCWYVMSSLLHKFPPVYLIIRKLLLRYSLPLCNSLFARFLINKDSSGRNLGRSARRGGIDTTTLVSKGV